TAPADIGNTEIAVTGGKNLKLIPSSGSPIYTINAGGNGRIFKISGSGTVLNLEDIKLEGGNAADGKGGAVYVEAGGILKLTDKTVITPSTGSDINTPGKNDVYLADGAKIKLDDALQSHGPIVARITPEHYNDGDEVLGGGSIGSGTPPNYTKFSVTQRDDGFLWTIQSDGTLKAIPTTINDSSGAWKKLKDAVRDLPEGSTITVNGTITATNDYGNDNRGVIDITKNITIQGQNGANSDMLNANRVSLGSYAHPVFRVSGGKTLTLKNLTLKGGKGIAGGTLGGGAILIPSGGGTTAELSDCVIEDCQAEKGGAIGCGNGTTVKLKNTRIKKCKTSGSGSASGGGAIFAQGATVEMTGCTLTGNEAKSGGAIYAQKHTSSPHTPSIVKIEGGTIGGTEEADANKATEVGTDGGGGGIYIGEACTLTMKAPAGSPAQGVRVIGNTAVYNGAGIYTKGNLTMEKCTITDNKTTGADDDTGGGGVYVESGIVEIKDATKIYHNYAGESGGGIYVKSGTVTLKNATIGGEQFYDGTDSGKTKGNNAQYCGGIHVKNGTITMENCTLSSNTARDVGGIQADNGNLTVKGCTLTNNKAAGFGGGIYVTGGTFTMENCTLTGNTTGNEGGGGVYVEGGTFKMKGSSRITPSTGGDANVAGKNDVYLKNDAKITVDSVLTGTAPVARITVPNTKYLPTTQVLTAGSGVPLENETYKFAVTPQTSPAPQEWTVGGNGCLKEGRYTEVPHGQLEAYLANNASATEVNYIEVTGIPEAALKGSYGSPPDPGPLGQKIKAADPKKVALKLPDGLSVTDMSACFSQCENLVSLENFPSGVTDMRACFYRCENLTTVPAIPATVTDMKECFYRCENLTTALNIPAGVYDMTKCFQYCEKLQSIKMNCPYGINFNGAFSGCDALPNGGIQVPSTQLGTYKANAGTMGTTKEKFVGF
ncbi:MAG: leucine-rich repeat protein, partial [Treponema sp.]|uniref:leucine-rich repeat protein n=1 Tax=Treponema sp. TaxID=166 RepID=UPI003FA214D7